MVVDGKQQAAPGLGGRPQEAGRAAAVAPYLEERPVHVHRRSLVEQGLTLVDGHEAPGGLGVSQYLGRATARYPATGIGGRHCLAGPRAGVVFLPRAVPPDHVVEDQVPDDPQGGERSGIGQLNREGATEDGVDYPDHSS